MSYLIAEIPINKIKKLSLHVTHCKKTLAQVKSEIGSDYVINGGMWNPDGSACPLLIRDRVPISNTPWQAYGYGWNEVNGHDIQMSLEWQSFKNFIACTPLIYDNIPIPSLSYGSAQGGKRGRTACGLKDGKLILYVSQDRTSDAKTPEKLRDYLFKYGCQSAIMLDSGGSSMCDFNGQRLTGDGRRVHNWLLVYIDKGSQNEFEHNTENQDNVSEWAKESWEKAVANGVLDGKRPIDNLTRQEMAVILDRLGLLK